MARNSPTLFVPSGNGPNRKISSPDSVNTPRYSSFRGEPLQAASTQIDGRMGWMLASLHFPIEAGLPLKDSYTDWYAVRASRNEPNDLYCAPAKPLTCFSASGQVVKMPGLRPFQTT